MTTLGIVSRAWHGKHSMSCSSLALKLFIIFIIRNLAFLITPLCFPLWSLFSDRFSLTVTKWLPGTQGYIPSLKSPGLKSTGVFLPQNSSRNTGVAFFNLALSFVLYCNSIWNQGDGLFILANGRSRVNLGINHCSQKDSMLWLVRSDTNHCVQENKMLWLVGVSHMVIRNESSDLGR